MCRGECNKKELKMRFIKKRRALKDIEFRIQSTWKGIKVIATFEEGEKQEVKRADQRLEFQQDSYVS